MNTMMGGIYSISEWIMRFAVINLLWLLFNLPIIFLVLSQASLQGEGLVGFLPIALLAPFVFFPATTAMFASVRDWIIDREKSSLIKTYGTYYKENYKQSFTAGLLYTILWVVWAADFVFFQDTNPILTSIFLISGLFLFIFTVNFFSVLAHYQMKTGSLIKKTFVITAGSPVLFLTLVTVSGITVYVSISGPLFILLLCSGSLFAFLAFSAFYRLYAKITERQAG